VLSNPAPNPFNVNQFVQKASEVKPVPPVTPVKWGSACGDDEIECVSTHQCVSASLKCDSNADCEDKSDEQGCYTGTLPDNYCTTFTAETGVVTSPGWPNATDNNMDICWIIQSTSGDNNINLHFTNFNIERFWPQFCWFCNFCLFDYLEIRDGASNTSPLMGRYCGDLLDIPSSFVSSGNALHLTFHTDFSVGKEGFRAEWSPTANCHGDVDSSCDVQFTAETGLLTSPGYPSNYSDNTDICYLIHYTSMPMDHNINLQFKNFILEGHYYDYLEIRDGGSNTSPLMGKYTGSVIPSTFVSSGNALLLKFHTDYSIVKQGFLAEWTPTATCYETFTAETGNLSSPGYPITYWNNMDICWIIHYRSMDYNIKLTFTGFDLEYQSVCGFDYLEIRDGASNTSPSKGKYCGSDIPSPIVSSGNALLLKFHTDGSVVRPGFRVEWSPTAPTGSDIDAVDETKPPAPTTLPAATTSPGTA